MMHAELHKVEHSIKYGRTEKYNINVNKCRDSVGAAEQDILMVTCFPREMYIFFEEKIYEDVYPRVRHGKDGCACNFTR